MEHKKFQNKVLIIYSNFYSEISDNLLDGATKFLKKENILYETLCVPGSLEIPFFLKKNREKFSGYIILGCIIKGETDHYEVVKRVPLIIFISFLTIIPFHCLQHYLL